MNIVFIASLQSPKVLCDSRAPQRTCFNIKLSRHVLAALVVTQCA